MKVQSSRDSGEGQQPPEENGPKDKLEETQFTRARQRTLQDDLKHDQDT